MDQIPDGTAPAAVVAAAAVPAAAAGTAAAAHGAVAGAADADAVVQVLAFEVQPYYEQAPAQDQISHEGLRTGDAWMTAVGTKCWSCLTPEARLQRLHSMSCRPSALPRTLQ